jgi:chemotaxis protein methyltransferase CheR
MLFPRNTNTSSSKDAPAQQGYAALQAPSLSDQEFACFRTLLYDIAGIYLAPEKKALVAGRLSKRIRECGLNSYGQYIQKLSGPQGTQELQKALDLLTTNETYFFREPKHFDFLQRILSGRVSRPFRVWSAASSSGEEVYSIAMTLAESLETGAWSVLGSDLSTRVLEKARAGSYPIERAKDIPPAYLSKYCLKGVGSKAGTFIIDRPIRAGVEFTQVNLNATLPSLGLFDLIFLRNVMIYFPQEIKRQVVARLIPLLKPGGHLFIGHSESLNGVTTDLEPLAPAIYRKPWAG